MDHGNDAWRKIPFWVEPTISRLLILMGFPLWTQHKHDDYRVVPCPNLWHKPPFKNSDLILRQRNGTLCRQIKLSCCAQTNGWIPFSFGSAYSHLRTNTRVNNSALKERFLQVICLKICLLWAPPSTKGVVLFWFFLFGGLPTISMKVCAQAVQVQAKKSA